MHDLPLEQTIEGGVPLCKLAVWTRCDNIVNGNHVHLPSFGVIVEMCPTYKHENGPEVVLGNGLLLDLEIQPLSDQSECLRVVAHCDTQCLLFRASLPVEQLDGKARNHLAERSRIPDAKGIPHPLVVLVAARNMIRKHCRSVS